MRNFRHGALSLSASSANVRRNSSNFRGCFRINAGAPIATVSAASARLTLDERAPENNLAGASERVATLTRGVDEDPRTRR